MSPEAFTLKTSFYADAENLYVYLNAGENSGATMYQICLIKDNTVATDAAQAWYNVTFADGAAAIAKAPGAAVDGATVSMTGTEIEVAIPIAAIYGEGFELPVETRILLVAQINGNTHMGTFHDGKNPNDDGWADRTGDGCPLTLNADGTYTIDLPADPVIDYLSVEKTTFAVGEPIMVTAIGEGTDWVGIQTAENADNGTGSAFWWYVTAVGSNTPFDLLSVVDGSGLTAELPAGEYVIRLLPDDQNYNSETVIEEIRIVIE